MFLDQREIGEELRQLLGDFPPDSPGSVLQFGRRNPAGNNVVSVDLQMKTRRHDREGCYFHVFFSFWGGRNAKRQQTEPLSNKTVHLYEGNICWKRLLDLFQPLQRLSEGGEVGHHGPQLMLRNKPRKELPRRTAQQVELDA